MPIFTALASAFGAVSSFIGGLGAVGKALLGIGMQVASAALQKTLAKRAARNQPTGAILETQFGEATAATVGFGRVGVAGQLVAEWSTGPNNADLIRVFALSRFPVSGLNGVWIDGKLETLGTAQPGIGLPVTSGDYAGLIWVKFLDGTQTAADSYLVSTANPSTIWTANHIGRGVAYAAVTMRYDRERLGAVPQFLFDLAPARLYDWRLDSTAGGTGAQRWNDQATWGASSNPIVQAYNYMRGLRVNGTFFAGMEIDPVDLPLARWTVAANICDEMVGSRRRYECSALMDLMADHGDNIDVLMKACGGTMVNGVGESWPIVGTSQPVVMTITDDDIIVGEPVTFQAIRPVDSLVNSVSGTFTNPANAFVAAAYARAQSSAALTADRRTRDVNLPLDMVTNAEQAAQLAAIALSENRFQKTAKLTLRPRFQVLEPGDWVQWNSDVAVRSGVYQVTGVEITATDDEAGPRNARIALQQRDGAIYTGVGVVLPPVVINPAEPVYQQELLNFTVAAVSMSGAPSVIQPAIRVSWTAPADPTVAGVTLEYRVKSGPANDIISRDITNGAVIALLTDGVVRRTVYEVRHRLITDPRRPVTASAWIEVTTNDVGTDADWQALGQDVRDFLNDADRRLNATLNYARNSAWHDTLSMVATLAESSVHAVETGSASARLSRETRILAASDAALSQQVTTLNAELNGKASAELVQVLEARVTATEGGITSQSSAITALDNRVTTAEGTVAASAAAVNTLQTTVTQQGDSITAISDASTSLSARVGNVDAGTLFQMTAEAAPSGYASQIAMFARGSVGGVTTFAGMRIRVSNAGEGEIVLAADRTLIADGSGNVLALFTPGGATINSARIANLSAANFTAGTITADTVVAGAVVSSSMSIGASANRATMSATPTGTPNSSGTAVVMREILLQFDASGTGTLPVLIDSLASAVMNWGTNSGNSRSMTYELRVDDRNGNGRVLATVTVSSSATNTGLMTASLSRFVLDSDAAPRADGTVRYYYTLASVYDSGMTVTVNTQARIGFWKR